MIGVDTNVLVRYLTADDPGQSGRARQILEHRLTWEEPGFISTVVLAELWWVLARAYGWDRDVICNVIERLLRVDRLLIEHAAEVFTAVAETRRTGADFADALIAGVAQAAGCKHTVTFDRRALRLPGFRLA